MFAKILMLLLVSACMMFNVINAGLTVPAVGGLLGGLGGLGEVLPPIVEDVTGLVEDVGDAVPPVISQVTGLLGGLTDGLNGI